MTAVTGQAALVTPGATEWGDVLRQIGHDLYHLPEYGALDARLSAGTAAAFVYEDDGRRLILPLVVRPVPNSELSDASSPYGYSGPVSDVADAAFWSRACEAMVALLCGHGIVSVFVRLHPLLPAPLSILEGFGAVVQHGETVSVDLSLSVDQLWQQTRSSFRNQISKARRAGVCVVMDDWSHFDDWLAIYHENMRRVGASPYYFFPAEHFHRLRDALGDRARLATAMIDGELVGGNLFFDYRGIMHTYLQATRSGPVHHADKLLYDEVRRWGKGRGNTVFHLGGGLGGANDSLFYYKAGFSERRHPFRTWRVVTDPDRYAGLVAAASDGAGGRASEYFPAYR